MNAYGPSFRYINRPPNHVVFEHATVHRFYQVNIDLKLEENTNTDLSNIYGLTDGAAYDSIGSQIPAVYLEPESMQLRICQFLDGASVCENLAEDAISANTWFNLKIEQNCWFGLCFINVLLDDVYQDVFYWINYSPATFYDVSGIIGNTYDQDNIVAASGQYANFYLDQSEDGSDISFVVTDAPTEEGASNYVAP